MTFSVIWKFTALLQLNSLIASSVDSASIQQTAAFIDFALRRVPHDMGESRDGNDRLWYVDSLGIYFAVDDNRLSVGPSRRQ